MSGEGDAGPFTEVHDLRVDFHTREGVAHAVNGVDFTLQAGQTVGILGESGSGKSVTAQAIMGILDMPPARIAGGAVRYRGVDLLQMDEAKRRHVRANKVAMIFQDALSSLNPVFTVTTLPLTKIASGASPGGCCATSPAASSTISSPNIVQRMSASCLQPPPDRSWAPN